MVIQRVPTSARPVRRLPAEASPEVKPEDSLRDAFERIAPSAHETDVTMLSDNLQAWNARWKLLESATDCIDAQYYTWDHDVFGKAQLGHVYYKALQGLEVRVQVDAVGDTYGQRGFKSHRGGKDYLQELVRLPNAQAKVYHPHYQKPLSFLLHPLGYEGLAANHDKILAVDGRAASVGGRNTSNCYFLHPNDDPTAWRDGDVLLQGKEATRELVDAFEAEFQHDAVLDTVRPDLLGNWVKRDAELLGAYALMDHWLKASPLSAAEKQALREPGPAREKATEELLGAACARLPELGLERAPGGREKKALRKLAAELVTYPELRGTYREQPEPSTRSSVKIIDKTSALGDVDEMNEALLGLIDGAQKKLLIQTPYYVLTDPVIDALKEAGERGVSIKIATNSPSNTDSFFTQVFFLNDWKKSLATIPNMELWAATGQRKHHAKMAVVDDEVAVVGTYNLDLVSARINGEVAAVVWSDKFAHTVTQAIEKDFQDPTVGYAQYRIARDSEGQAVDAAGQTVLDASGKFVGEPQALFGPENHVDPETLHKYDKKIRHWNWARKHIPQFNSLRRFVP